MHPYGCCLWIGSPVYAGHAVPPIMDFISALPQNTASYAVPFVTWGKVTSGIALHEMGTMLTERGHKVLGAAKVVAVHSMMWDVANPLEQGYPDAEDDALLKQLAKTIDVKLSGDNVASLPLDALNYQPKQVQESMSKMNLEKAKQIHPSRELDETVCTKCGNCIEKCPADAITLNPYPQFGNECFLCCNCVRHCKERALKTDLSGFVNRLREMSEMMNEQPLSQLFV